MQRRGVVTFVRGTLSTRPVRSVACAAMGFLGMACGSSDGAPNPVAGVTAQTPGLQPQSVGASTRASIQKYIDSLYQRTEVRHGFRTRFGDDVDCIDFNSFPSVKEAAQKGITLRNEGPPAPPPLPPRGSSAGLQPLFDGSLDEDGQERRCPAGTVAHPRLTVDKIVAAGGLATLSDHHKKGPPPPAPCGTDIADYSHITGRQDITNNGGLAVIASYNPPAQSGTTAHSLGQIWSYANGSNGLETAEVGWIVSPQDYQGSTATWLFSYFTNDGYQSTGCYGYPGSPCGFTPVSGAEFSPNMQILSEPAFGTGDPPELAVQTFNPGSTYPKAYQNWYIYVDGNLIGYYPQVYYSGQMTTSAATFQSGGEIVQTNVTQTCMGSCNDFWDDGYGYGLAAYSQSNYYLAPGTGSSQCTYGPCCSNGYCYKQPSFQYCVQGVNAPAVGHYSTTYPAGTTNSGKWGTYFYWGTAVP